MSTAPYFDRVVTKSQLAQLISDAGGVHNKQRSKPGIIVYTLAGGGEGMVEKSGANFRLRLFRGKCAC